MARVALRRLAMLAPCHRESKSRLKGIPKRRRNGGNDSKKERRFCKKKQKKPKSPPAQKTAEINFIFERRNKNEVLEKY